MADAEVTRAKKQASQAAAGKEKELFASKPSAPEKNTTEGRKDTSRKSTATKASGSKLQNPESINADVWGILREMNSNVTQQGNEIESLSKRVDDLYCDENQYDYPYDNDDYEYDQYSDIQDNRSTQGQSVCNDSVSQEDGPPSAKKQCTDNGVFKKLSAKFQSVEKTDSGVNENLASSVNTSFRKGISDDALNDLLKDIHRPVNCESLVKTRVNGCIWRTLGPQTQTMDMKLQAIQNFVIKASVNLTKLMDKNGDKLDDESMELGSNALALLGHSNKVINNKRKEFHRYDLDPKYYPLALSSLPFTENLYGDDVNKSDKDIKDMGHLGREMGRGGSFRGRRRGGRPMFGNRGRGFHRGKNSRTGFRKSSQ